MADTAIKLQEAGTGPDLFLLINYLRLLQDCDIFDQVRAKLHKAVGRAYLAQGGKEPAAEHYRRALELHDKVGIKKELEVLEREIKKDKEAEQAAKAEAEQAAAEQAAKDAEQQATENGTTEQQGPADGETS